jgi:hypothetical protein
MSDDPNLSKRYRELPREEPSRALDDAILAASRRAVRPRRWFGPLAAAAVITLAVAVTLHVQHDRPGEEIDAVSPAMKVQETPKPEAPRPAPLRAPQAFPVEPRADTARAAPAAPAAQEERKAVGEIAAAPSAGARPSRDERPRAQSQMARAAIEPTPESEIERIARLRAAGRHEEADRLLAEFRKRYPDYRLSDEMKAKVERR